LFQPVAAAHCSIDDDTPHAWGPVLTQSYEQTTARINFSMMTFKEDNSPTIVTTSGFRNGSNEAVKTHRKPPQRTASAAHVMCYEFSGKASRAGEKTGARDPDGDTKNPHEHRNQSYEQLEHSTTALNRSKPAVKTPDNSPKNLQMAHGWRETTRTSLGLVGRWL